MALFRHPHLTRGIVHTPHGNFQIVRGIADIPEEVGEALGWARSESYGNLNQDNSPAMSNVMLAGRTSSARRSL